MPSAFSNCFSLRAIRSIWRKRATFLRYTAIS